MTLMDTLPDTTTRKGAIPETVEAVYVRDLAEDDILTVFTMTANVSHSPIKKISEGHHNLAKLLAAGMKNVDAGRITGYDPSRISILKTDPAFQELMAHYKDLQEAAFADVHEQMAQLGITILSEMQERLESAPEAVEFDSLRKTLETVMDRTGRGPTKTVRKIDAGTFIKDLLEEAKAERRGEVRARVIDVTPS